jgi:Domain of unknown function (DUF5606)
MNFKELVSISGLGGLFQLVATKSDGAIVKGLDDGQTKFVAARSHSVTALDGIEVFTTGENIRLYEAMQTIKTNDDATFDLAKADNKAIQAHFKKVLPTHDADRVYVSDMKKILKWYSLVNAKGMLDAAAEETTTEETAEASEAKPKEAKATKAAKPKAAAAATKAPKVQTASKSAAKSTSKVGRGS